MLNTWNTHLPAVVCLSVSSNKLLLTSFKNNHIPLLFPLKDNLAKQSDSNTNRIKTNFFFYFKNVIFKSLSTMVQNYWSAVTADSSRPLLGTKKVDVYCWLWLIIFFIMIYFKFKLKNWKYIDRFISRTASDIFDLSSPLLLSVLIASTCLPTKALNSWRRSCCLP